MMDELKPCPFCGSTRLTVRQNELLSIDGVQCLDCWAYEPELPEGMSAVERWNMRATPAGMVTISTDTLGEVMNLLRSLEVTGNNALSAIDARGVELLAGEFAASSQSD
jgi:Lar family restriction alleviation protein